MDYWIELLGADNIKMGVAAMALLFYGVAKAWANNLVRRADQQWQDDDGDDEVAVNRVTDKVQAESALMSMLPRGVVERQVRRSRGSGPPPPNESPPG